MSALDVLICTYERPAAVVQAARDVLDQLGAEDGLLLPIEMAETYYHVATQHRPAWTHELDLRSYSDVAWWNHQ